MNVWMCNFENQLFMGALYIIMYILNYFEIVFFGGVNVLIDFTVSRCGRIQEEMRRGQTAAKDT